MGPLISKVHQEKVLSYFEQARREGGTLHSGGDIVAPAGFEKGFWVQPTIATGLQESGRVQKEENFWTILSYHTVPRRRRGHCHGQ